MAEDAKQDNAAETSQENVAPQENASKDGGAPEAKKVQADQPGFAAERGPKNIGKAPALPKLVDDKTLKKRPKKLADCAQEVKESMKRKDATVAIEKALKMADAAIGAYKSQYMRWKIKSENEETDETEPQKPDFKALAEKYNLEFNETELLDINDLLETEIGKVRVLQVVRGADGRPQTLFPSIAEIIFDRYQDTSEFDPKHESDMTNNYSYWLSEKTDARVPDFTEAKEAVIEFWKKKKALEKARVTADEIASSVTKDQTLVGLHAEKAVSTGEFTWFTTIGGQPRISTPVGTEDVGDEFMNVAFGLEQYQSGVAANITREKVYVIQLLSEKAGIAESGTDYLENRFFKFKQIPPDVRNIGMWYTQDLYRDWNDEFIKRMGLELVGQ